MSIFSVPLRVSACIVCVFLLCIPFAQASFYQAQTLSAYCEEYVRYIELGNSVNDYEAGVCAGFVASTIELMELSERLCKRDELNLDTVVKQFIQAAANETASENSATFVLVNVLQDNYACEA